MTGVLEGIRVVDMGHFVAIPAAGAMLADWGAEVIKIEPLSRRGRARDSRSVVKGQSQCHAWDQYVRPAQQE